MGVQTAKGATFCLEYLNRVEGAVYLLKWDSKRALDTGFCLPCGVELVYIRYGNLLGCLVWSG